eukprot:TRINITY_DN23063_c0_g1_i1.p1 TRINITY_DN23063_c0_g1~~TRINITY_DN23063_c0_g1_i1.p1  ORF type:complete len:624 (-),score=145.33 TRINITY_DN23063_c0_g1_i1:45-1868(-)
MAGVEDDHSSAVLRAELATLRKEMLDDIRDLFSQQEEKLQASFLQSAQRRHARRKKSKGLNNGLAVNNEAGEFKEDCVHPHSPLTSWAFQPGASGQTKKGSSAPPSPGVQDEAWSSREAKMSVMPAPPASSPSTLNAEGPDRKAAGLRSSLPRELRSDMEEEFGDIKMKQGVFTEVQQAVKLDEDLYDVTNFYKKEGFAQKLARSDRFEKLTLFIISLNAVYIGIDADNNHAPTLLEASWFFQVFDHLFCVFFTFELMVRFAAFATKWNCLKDRWFVFDGFLVGLMVFETWILTVCLAIAGGQGAALPTGPLRLLRLLRLSRLVRLLRAAPELLTLVNGMKTATRAVSSSLLLIVLLNYIAAIVLNMFLADIGQTASAAEARSMMKSHFGSLGNCMWTLTWDGTFMDSTKFVLDTLRGLAVDQWDAMRHGDWALVWCMILMFAFYILLTQVTVMNMLIGVLCEVVSQVKRADEEKVAIDFMKQYLRGMLVMLDGDGNSQISKDELAEVVQIPAACEVLDQLEINPLTVMMMTEQLFEEDADAGRVQEVTREELMEVILKIRGNREVTMRDLVETRCDIRRMLTRRVDEICEKIAILMQKLDYSDDEG